MLAVTVMTVLMIAPIRLVMTRKDRCMKMISMRILPASPLYNTPVYYVNKLFMYITVKVCKSVECTVV
jgi:hypothetical protein